MKKEHNAADEEVVRDAKQRVKNERDQELDDIKTLLATPAGVRFFRRLLADGKMFATTFTGNSTGFFLEGARNLSLKYFADVCEAAPEKVAELVMKPKETQDGE